MLTLLRRIVLLLALVESGYMTFDGTRALLVGDYIRPTSGEYAGHLGPWADVVGSIGLDPESIAMKMIFVAYGILWISAIVANMVNEMWGRGMLLLLAIGSLWYLWFGTICSVLQILLLIEMRRLELRGDGIG